MLLYNHKQEFIGVSEEGLRLLNYSSLVELLAVCSDVADLFANEPGYIHNFKNFGWIDFLLHADSDASSAIIHANGRVFSCQLSVSFFYLCENPTQKAYNIEILHVKSISGEDVKPHTITAKAVQKEESTFGSLPNYADITPTQLNEPNILDVPQLTLSSFDDELHDDDLALTPAFKDDLIETFPSKEEVVVATPVAIPKKLQEKPMMGSGKYNAQEQECLDRHHVGKNYVYDPNVAANELGLPVDLIEEFIGDFIQQSYDFKEDLFESSAKNDLNNLHILSHKLKGVAANLRIEDAFETLSVINTSSDPVEIEANLKYYFEMIQKLKGGEIQEEQNASESITSEPYSNADQSQKSTAAITDEALDDIYSFGLKQYDNDSLVIHGHELEVSELPESAPFEEPVFKKEFLEIEKAGSIEEEPAVEKERTFDEMFPVKEEPVLEEVKKLPEIIKEPAAPKLQYDSFTVAKSLGIEPEFMDELIFDYKNDSRIISNQITSAIQAFDTTMWNESAARLKGISDNLRLTEISEELSILSKTHDAQEAKKASLRLNAYLDQL